MTLDRRELLAGSGALFAGCAGSRGAPEPAPLDALLDAHADALPENGGGANHYPMAAEVLETLDQAASIPDDWRTGAAAYAGATPRRAPIVGAHEALGEPDRHGDWLDLFRDELAREPWSAVVARWTPELTPGVSAAVFHGLIRTAHAVRGLRRAETPARRAELAVALAYWASRYAELGTADDLELTTPLAELAHPWVEDVEDVPFHGVRARLSRAAIAPRVTLAAPGRSAEQELDALVRESAVAFLEMLVQERHRLWLLHTVTGPAAAALLVPELDRDDARALAAYTRQAVVALYVAFGAPYTPREHVRAATQPWSELVQRAAASNSVHTLKLVEALARHASSDDALCRSVAAQWFEWT